MENYYYVQCSIPLELQDLFDARAMDEFECLGIEDFSLDEPAVDQLLGEKSYSGGDIPEEEIFKVEKSMQDSGVIKKYYFQTKNQCENFHKELIRENIKGAHILEKEVRDWNEEWKKNFSAIDVFDGLKIVPSWEKKSLKQGELYIYPGMGFGTGSHETTYLCLKYLENLDYYKFKNCLDFGCGSGILGLALYMLNREVKVDLYDIDQQALDNAKQNIDLNEYGESSFQYLLPKNYSEIVEKKYELVFANILLKTLKLESNHIISHLKSNSILILSGLLRGQEEEVIEYYQSKEPLLVVREKSFKGDWAAVLMEMQ